MPYILQSQREIVDPLIDQLAQAMVKAAGEEEILANNPAAFAGVMNYTCTRLMLKVIRFRFGALRYWIIATITGTFHNIADEFYRRLATPYENICMEKNGDVDLYKEYVYELTLKGNL